MDRQLGEDLLEIHLFRFGLLLRHRILCLPRNKEVSDNEHKRLLFSVRRLVRYHGKRRGFFDLIDSTLKNPGFGSWNLDGVLFVDGGASASVVLGTCIAVVTAFQVVCGFSKKAALHLWLMKGFIRLEQKLRASDDEDTVQLVIQGRLDLESEEPPVKRYLDVICHNEQVLSEDGLETDMWDVNCWQRLTAHFTNVGSHRFHRLGCSGSEEEKKGGREMWMDEFVDSEDDDDLLDDDDDDILEHSDIAPPPKQILGGF